MFPIADRGRRAAEVLSTVGHPFSMVLVTIVLVSMRDTGLARALAIGAAAALLTIIPLILLIWRKVVTRQWSDHNVSDPSHRRHFYPFAIAITSASGLGLWLVGSPSTIVRGAFVSAALLIVASVVSRWSKISLHTSFGVLCAVALVSVSAWVAAVALILAAAVGWSRVQLARHTLAQVLSGAALGAAGGFIVLRPVLGL